MRFLLVLILLSTACYPHRGRTVNATPAELMEHARDSCLRNDHRAHQTYLERVIREHPDSEEAILARESLDTSQGACPEPGSGEDS